MSIVANVKPRKLHMRLQLLDLRAMETVRRFLRFAFGMTTFQTTLEIGRFRGENYCPEGISAIRAIFG